jgi:hypothetical protein
MLKTVPSKTSGTSSVGFVEGRFENVIDAEPIAYTLDCLGNLKTKLKRLDHTWASNQQKPARITTHMLPNLNWRQVLIGC